MKIKSILPLLFALSLVSGCGPELTEKDLQQAAKNMTSNLEETSQRAVHLLVKETESQILNKVTEEGGKVIGSLLKGEEIDLITTIDTALQLREGSSNLIIPGELISIKGICRSVTDGDTYSIKLSNGTIETVRAFSINSPESVGKYADNPMPFGKEASNYVKETMEGKTVELLVTPNLDRDKYGRLLAFVKIHGQSIQGLLLKKGLAMISYTEPGTPFYDEFVHLQNEAKKAKKGIWSIEGYATPFGYDLKRIQ